ACGAIENARLLLASNDRKPAGLGNDHDLVGRFLIDHLNPAIASFDPKHAPVLLERFGHYWLDDERGRHVYYAGVALSERVQRKRGLPGCTASLLAEPREDAALLALRRVLSASRGDARAIARDLVQVSRGPLELLRAAVRRAGHRPEILPVTALQLVTMIEQIPDPESRVTLSDARDPLGVPIVRVDWRVHEEERDAAVTMLELIEREFARIGLPAPRPAPWVIGEASWRDTVDDIAHPMGTTRMASDPRAGVVDPRCAVFGVEGLYVAGGSVFPTAGCANPTLMMVALALRLADTVRARALTGDAPSVRSGARGASLVRRPRERLRVGILGAGQRVRGVYLPVLAALEERFEIAGVTSRSRDRAEALGIPVFDGIEELVRDGRPHLLLSCVSDPENGHVLSSLLTLGIPVLTETPLAWSLRQARSLVKRIAEARALVGVAENWPHFPVEELKASLRDAGVLGRVLAAHDDRASFEYHSIAQMRRYLGHDRKPVEASAIRGACMLASRAGREAWQTGSVRYDDGAMMHHQHGAAGASLHRIPGALRIHGELASMSGEELRTADGAVTRARRRYGQRGELRRIEIGVPGVGVIAWSNPYAAHVLSDDQIAFARHLDAMRRAVLGEGEPLYTAADALVDLEIL
ncbi:MAG TPA: GMC oxidoreductase, partial [Sandaracinaceae bacterium]